MVGRSFRSQAAISYESDGWKRMTGVTPLRTTPWATPPKSNSPIGRREWVAMTMRSTPSARAAATIMREVSSASGTREVPPFGKSLSSAASSSWI